MVAYFSVVDYDFLRFWRPERKRGKLDCCRGEIWEEDGIDLDL